MSNLTANSTRLPPGQQAIRDKCFHPTGTFVEFAKEEVEQSIPERFEKIACLYPDRIAIKTKQKTITYAELNQVSNRIAQAILDNCGEGNHPVAILMEHGDSVLVAILAALKAGKIYVPLDPSYPPERLRFMLHDAEAKLILTDQRNLALSAEIIAPDCQVMNGEEIKTDVETNRILPQATPDALAYILYTSGSTGRPKGVFDNHRNVLHGTLRFTNGIHICAEDRLTLTNSCSSSASVRRIFPALLNGASLFPFSVRQEGIEELFRLVIREQITYVSLGRIRDLVRALDRTRQFNSIRLASFGGEITHKRDVEICRKLFPPQCIVGMWLSSTETGNVTQFLIDRETRISGDILPIGYPAEDMQVMLLDDAGQPAADGETGEIAVKSSYLSLGYWRRPDLTRARFLPDPGGGTERVYLTGDLARREPDGCLFHRGRKDDQVKVRGYRVETAEVEAALLKVGGVKKAFVTARELASGNRALVAYMMTEPRSAPTATELRRTLAETLPEHMIPSLFVVRDQLPLTPTGKIDRASLPVPGRDRPNLNTAYVAPTTPMEAALSYIWSEVLSLDQVGIHDSFFDLGGHSLMAAQVVSRVVRKFQLEVPCQALFQTFTVAEMATVIRAHQGKRLGEKEIKRVLNEIEALSDEEARHLVYHEAEHRGDSDE